MRANNYGARRRALSIAASLTMACFAMPRVLPATDADYEPPSNYYASAAGLTGTALQSQLRTIMSSGFVGRSYGDSRYADAILDQDPGNAANVLLVYSRASVAAAWDGGTTWNREHLWPVSLLGTSDPGNSQIDMRSDEFLLRPVKPSINSARSNEYYGPAGGSGGYQDYGSYWYPGAADAGDVARSLFYAATRYPTYNGHGLSLVDGQPSTYQMGDLNSLLHWNYCDAPDAFERRRNQAVFSSTLNPTYYQGNRNAFIDHPEYVWSIFADQANDTSITTNAHAVDLGRIIVGASFGVGSMTINKTGSDGTYCEVRTAGSAASTVSGRYNAFPMDAAGSIVTTVGLSASTAVAGLKSGTVAVDNLDVTTGGGAGKGANDPDDVVGVTGTVLDHARPSFSGETELKTLTLNFGSITQNSGTRSRTFGLFNLVQTAGYTAKLDLDSMAFSGDAGVFSSTAATFADLSAGDSRTFSVYCDTASLGTFGGAYSLTCSDEDVAGAATFSPLTLTVTGTIVAAPEPAALALLVAGAPGAMALIWQRKRNNKLQM